MENQRETWVGVLHERSREAWQDISLAAACVASGRGTQEGSKSW